MGLTWAITEGLRPGEEVPEVWGNVPPPPFLFFSMVWGLVPCLINKNQLYLVQDFMGAGPSFPGEGAHRLAWEGAIPPEVGAAGWDGDT